MSVKHFLIALFVLISMTPLRAADTNHDGTDTILLPIGFRINGSETSFPGAFGTRWVGETILHNHGNVAIPVEPNGGLCEICTLKYYPPGYFGPLEEVRWRNPERGILLQPLAPGGDGLTFSSRLSEVTRHAQPQGFQMPVVREEQFLKGTAYFVAIPSGAAVRTSLRLFDPRRQAGTSVHVEVLDDHNVVRGEMTIPLPFPTASAPDLLQPGFAIINDFASTIPGLQDLPQYHMRVTPLPADREYWGMVSVTDNDTQQVLIITPQ